MTLESMGCLYPIHIDDGSRAICKINKDLCIAVLGRYEMSETQVMQ